MPTYERHKLIQDVREAVSRDPSIAKDLLAIVVEGMDAWQQSVHRHLDQAADMGIGAAIGLPAYQPGKPWLNVDDHAHRSLARLVAVGWNLNTRVPSSGLEKALVDFVREADRVYPSDAAGHYRVLQATPIPQAAP